MTPSDDRALINWRDIPAAVGLLSRLPVPVDAEQATARGARAAWAYPLAGLVLALIAGGVGTLAGWAGLGPELVAGLVVSIWVICTGALHEDGLADCADGFWGGWDRDRRLEIMKDSRIGAYGVIALVLGLGLRWQALTVCFEAGLYWAALIPAAMVSRAAMVAVMAGLPPARPGGLAHAVGRPGFWVAVLAGLIALLAAMSVAHWAGLLAAGVAAAVAWIAGRIALNKIGGQTGDVLGATQQVTEIVVLLTLAAMI